MLVSRGIRFAITTGVIGCLLLTRGVFAQDAPSEKPVTINQTPGSDSQLQAVWLDVTKAVDSGTNLGLEFDAASPALRSQLDLPEDQAVVIVSVVPGSPADVAGVKPHDVILTFSEKPAGSVDTFRSSLNAVHDKWADEKGDRTAVSVTVLRAGKKVDLKLSPLKQGETHFAWTARLLASSEDGQKYWIGVAVSDVDAPLRAQLSLPENLGVVVTEVYPEFAGDKAGLKVHDVLLELRDLPLTSTTVLREQVQELGGTGNAGTLKLLRGGKPATLSITPIEKKQALGYLKPDDARLIQAYQLQASDLQNLSSIIALDQSKGQQLHLTAPYAWTNLRGNVITSLQATAAPADAAGLTGSQAKELLEAIRQLTAKVEMLEQAIKKPAEPAAK